VPLTLLDYGRPKPFGETIGKPRRLAWPVNVYRVTLPMPSDDGERMNFFERVILKLIEAAALRDAEALAQETCLPIDLVQCGLLRLQDQGYLDESNQIIKQRRDSWASDAPDPQEYITACMFRELATGKILPHLHVLKENPLRRKEEEERFYMRIRWDGEHRDNPPTSRDVISALRGMQRRSMAFGNECRLPSAQLISIAEDAERYHLDCPVAIQKSDGEFRIADPFGNGFSLVLESAFRCLLETNETLREWLMGWKTNLSNRGRDSQAAAHREPYDNDTNWARYPKLLSILRLGRNRQFRSIEQIYTAFEWAIFYSCAQRPYASAVQRLKLTTQSEHPAILQEAAEALSLVLPPGGLFPVREGKLDDFLAGKAEMGTVLSLSLLLAVNDASHPLRRIAAAHQDFIVRLLRIKKDRDDPAHGAGRVRSKDVELPDESFMREVVTALLPSIRFSDAPASTVNKEAVSDALMDARTSIQSEFGFALFNRLGSNLQDRLIVAERFWLSCNDGDNALAFACDLYAALQAAFRRALVSALPPDVQDADYVSTAQKNAEAHGLGLLPACLRKVKRSAIRETLKGNDQTLQSCVVAFLLVSSGDSLSAIAQAHPAFIADAAHVVDRRGHGNEPLPWPRDDIRKLRKAAYTIIKTLLEA
jgi:hypothetical protein